MDLDLNFALFFLGPPLVGELAFLFLLSRSGWLNHARRGWFRPALVILASCLQAVLLMFGGGEVYYRHVYDDTDSMDFTKVSRQWMDRYFIKNSAGYRDNVQYSKLIEPGKRRITFLGDSFAAGHGIRNVEDRFANILRRDHPGWEIQVVAQLGADTGDELALLKMITEDGCQLDQVVLVYCLNDIGDLMPEWYAGLAKLSAQTGQGGWLRRHSFLIDTLYLRYKVLRDPVVSRYFNYVRDGYQTVWAAQQQRLRVLRRMIESRGGRLLVVTFPFVHAVGPDYEYRFMHDKLDQFWSEQGVPHLDLLSIYSNLPPSKLVVNRYDAHPNEYANARAAAVIEPFIKTNLLSSPPR